MPLISHCCLLDASGVLLGSHVVSSELFWDHVAASGVLLGSHVASSGLSRDRLGLVFGHLWCISGSLGRILAVHLRI